MPGSASDLPALCRWKVDELGGKGGRVGRGFTRIPGRDEARVQLRGHLAALLGAAGAEGLPATGQAKSPRAAACGLDVFSWSESWDAGTGFEPVTFRL